MQWVRRLREELESSSEDETKTGDWGGLATGYINLRRPKSTWNDGYLGESLLYTINNFLRRFGAPRHRFWRINDDLKDKRQEHYSTHKLVNGDHVIGSKIKFMACVWYGQATRTKGWVTVVKRQKKGYVSTLLIF